MRKPALLGRTGMRLASFRRLGPGTALALALAAVPRASDAADDALITHVVAGSWQSSDFRDPANLGCSIGGNGSAPGSRLIMGASQRKPAPMSLVIRKTGWAIPAGIQVQVRATFPDGSTLDFTGRGRGQAVEIDLDGDQLRAWVHDLTANPSMQLTFTGNESPWQFDLTGTTKVVNAMGDCFAAHRIEGVGPPFSGAVSADAGRGTSATQPVGGMPASVPDLALALKPSGADSQSATGPLGATAAESTSNQTLSLICRFSGYYDLLPETSEPSRYFNNIVLSYTLDLARKSVLDGWANDKRIKVSPNSIDINWKGNVWLSVDRRTGELVGSGEADYESYVVRGSCEKAPPQQVLRDISLIEVSHCPFWKVTKNLVVGQRSIVGQRSRSIRARCSTIGSEVRHRR